MSSRHLSAAVLGLGLLVGLLAAVGLLVGFRPSRLPPVLLDVAAYKLALASAFALMTTGARLGRGTGRRSRPSPHTADVLQPPSPAAPAREAITASAVDRRAPRHHGG
jgi:hypothetical protein